MGLGAHLRRSWSYAVERSIRAPSKGRSNAGEILDVPRYELDAIRERADVWGARGEREGQWVTPPRLGRPGCAFWNGSTDAAKVH